MSSTRAEFEAVQQRAHERWADLWDGDHSVVSVGVDSSSLAKGAVEVLAACRRALAGTRSVVREVSGNGAMWIEPWVEIKRPGEPPILYGPIQPGEVPALLAGELSERAIGVRGDAPFNGVPPLAAHPFFKHQLRIVLANAGIIEPDSIDDALARGAYSAYLKVLFEMPAEEAIAEVTAANLRGRGG
ncbi:MAG: NADH-quinone oxidoreductase subunit F, partial [Chloroflexia bacterium]|nr:NADH-quinone oxidoreductase subunit F [Chloroflexia bacterium]